jgi:hypothetical protein
MNSQKQHVDNQTQNYKTQCSMDVDVAVLTLAMRLQRQGQTQGEAAVQVEESDSFEFDLNSVHTGRHNHCKWVVITSINRWKQTTTDSHCLNLNDWPAIGAENWSTYRCS